MDFNLPRKVDTILSKLEYLALEKDKEYSSFLEELDRVCIELLDSNELSKEEYYSILDRYSGYYE